MAWSVSDAGDQSGRVAVVTGANSGIGFHTARALAGAGATVVLACRRTEAATDAETAIRLVHGDADLWVLELDLADLSSVAKAADDLRARHDRIDLLINNAGVMALPHRLTADGFEMQFGTNHLGHFAWTGRLIDRVVAAGAGSRVVTVSSAVHLLGRMDFDDLMGERHYDKWKAYGQSKVANLLFSRELQKRLAAAGALTITTAAHPGYASTHLQTAGPEMAGETRGVRIFTVLNRVVAQSAAAGAQPTLRAALDPQARPDDYYGPLFEAWGPPTRSPRMPHVRDDEAATRLWQVSEELTGVTFDLG